MIRSEMLWKRGITSTVAKALCALAVGGFVGCAGDDDEGARSITSIVSLNDNLPVASDVYDRGQNKTDPNDDFVPEDYLKIVVTSRPHDPALTLRPDRAFGTVRFTRYSLDFERNDLGGNGVDDLTDFVNYPMNLVVPINGEGTGYVLAIPAAWKLEDEILPLRAGGSFLTTATLTIYGEEETSHEQIQLSGGVVVGIANYQDK
ncbi:MAG: hypothetical protein SGI90_13150 [Candidatus Eisenbacteria bacterium]|nr:hypothetical protein [Candidatus Eisenbacteria bacterium]